MTPLAIVTDIEGTTSSLSFVHEVLFPYSRARLEHWVAVHPQEAAPVLDQVRAEAANPALDVQDCIKLLLEWHDADCKIGPLKSLQGMIWAEGFATGELTGHVYPDAAAGLSRWHDAGIALYIYSSGSVAAQKLIFGRTQYGDLTALFSGYFDTAVGGKREAGSYCTIAESIGLPPAEVLFLSDVEAELQAARDAGMAVALLAREDIPEHSPFPVHASFDTILPEVALA